MKIEVHLPPDDKGFTGRECPQCRRYFKVKFRPGLRGSRLHCPYCRFSDYQHAFDTKDQIKYAKSVALKKVMDELIEPKLQELEHSFRELERASRGGLIQIRVDTKRSPLMMPLDRYYEKEVETYVECDHCGLEFAIYGVFADCPDCGTLNALIIFRKSIEVAHKRIKLIDLTKNYPELKNAILTDALSGGVSAFDALGKTLQARYPIMFPGRSRNLFQNLKALSKGLTRSIGKSLSELLGKENSDFLWKMFQVRHICEHNMGVIDDNFIRNVPDMLHLKDRKYPLEQEEINKFLECVLFAGDKMLEIIE